MEKEDRLEKIPMEEALEREVDCGVSDPKLWALRGVYFADDGARESPFGLARTRFEGFT